MMRWPLSRAREGLCVVKSSTQGHHQCGRFRRHGRAMTETARMCGTYYATLVQPAELRVVRHLHDPSLNVLQAFQRTNCSWILPNP